ncbi:hypothetical protein [Trichothermofontia sp.]
MTGLPAILLARLGEIRANLTLPQPTITLWGRHHINLGSLSFVPRGLGWGAVSLLGAPIRE